MKFTTQGGRQSDQSTAKITTDKAEYYEAGNKVLGGGCRARKQGEGLLSSAFKPSSKGQKGPPHKDRGNNECPFRSCLEPCDSPMAPYC